MPVDWRDKPLKESKHFPTTDNSLAAQATPSSPITHNKHPVRVGQSTGYGYAGDYMDDSYPDYSRRTFDDEEETNPIMKSRIEDNVALTISPFHRIPVEEGKEEGVKFLDVFYKTFRGSEKEFKKNVMDVGIFYEKHAHAVYKRENWWSKGTKKYSKYNDGKPVTLKRSFIEIGDIDQLKLDKFGRVEKLMVNGSFVSNPKKYISIKRGSTSNRVWGAPRSRQLFNMEVKGALLLNTIPMGLGQMSHPDIQFEINEGEMFNMFVNDWGLSEEDAIAKIEQAKSGLIKRQTDYRRTAAHSFIETEHINTKLLETQQHRSIAPEVREFTNQLNDLGGRTSIHGTDTNKATKQMQAKMSQQVKTIPTRNDITSDFIEEEYDNIFMQHGRYDLLGSVTVIWDSTIPIDALEEAQRDALRSTYIPSYAKKWARELGVEPPTDEQLAGIRENSARQDHSKKVEAE